MVVGHLEAETAVATGVVAWLVQVDVDFRVTQSPAASIAVYVAALNLFRGHLGDQVNGEAAVDLLRGVVETNQPAVIILPGLQQLKV